MDSLIATPKQMKGMIVCVAGTKGSGKDTVCDHLVSNWGFKKYAFADALKQVALPLIHAMWPSLAHVTLEDLYDRAKKEEIHPEISFGGKPFSIRWFLQFLGTDIMRTHLSDEIWVDTVVKRVSEDFAANPLSRICISDCRFENEVQRFRCLSIPCVSLRLHRSTPREAFSAMHVSEMQEFDVDFDLHNSSDIPTLCRKMEDLLKLRG